MIGGIKMAVDITHELDILDHSKVGSEIKQAIWDALYRISQTEPSPQRGYDIGLVADFHWGIIGEYYIGIPEEVTS